MSTEIVKSAEILKLADQLNLDPSEIDLDMLDPDEDAFLADFEANQFNEEVDG